MNWILHFWRKRQAVRRVTRIFAEPSQFSVGAAATPAELEKAARIEAWLNGFGERMEGQQ